MTNPNDIPILKETLENIMQIGTIGNFHGNLQVYSKNEKYFWCIEDHSYFSKDNKREQEITKELYDALVKFQTESNKPVQNSEPIKSVCATCNGSGQVEVRRIGYDSIMGKCPNCKNNI